MAWELHDLLSLSNYNSFPSQQELEENLAVWTKALEDCKNNEQLVTVSNYRKTNNASKNYCNLFKLF